MLYRMPADDLANWYRALAKELCTRLEEAAGAPPDTLDANEALRRIGLIVIAADLEPRIRDKSEWPKLKREEEHLDEIIVSVETILGVVEAFREISEEFPPSDIGKEIDPTLAGIDFRKLASDLRSLHAFYSKKAKGLEMYMRAKAVQRSCRGRPPDTIATAIAVAVAPLWGAVSDKIGVWRDTNTGEYRGALFDVAEWLADRLGVTVAPVTLAKKLTEAVKRERRKATLQK